MEQSLAIYQCDHRFIGHDKPDFVTIRRDEPNRRAFCFWLWTVPVLYKVVFGHGPGRFRVLICRYGGQRT